MDSELLISSQNKVVEKLNKTTKRIQKARKNRKIAEKEAAEFEEIHKLLNGSETLESVNVESEFLTKENESSELSVIPITFPGVKVFHDEFVFSLFKESDCCLKDFINNEEKCQIFGKDESIPTEECFRKLIVYHVAENLMPEQENCSSINLYVFYLMSVHSDPDFVTACFNFLQFRTFHIRPEDVFPVFLNFGARHEDLFDICKGSFVTKFLEKIKNNEGVNEKAEFPFFNVEMVGRILLQYTNENLLTINSNIKSFVKGLAKTLLDGKIRCGALLPIYSTILSVLCAKIQKYFSAEEILTWVHLKDEHLLNQLELCRNISRPICFDLHERLVLKILSQILKTNSLGRPPIKINHIKSVLKKLKSIELPLLELFSVLQLINISLPSLTATVKDSTEINALLNSLEQKIIKTEDSVDLIRLKLEVAKVGNMVTNSVKCNRFTVFDTVKKSPAKKIRKFGGTVGKSVEKVTHIVIEDSVADEKENCLSGLKKYGLEEGGGKDVKYVKVKWVSKCLGCKRLMDTSSFEIRWLREELECSTSSEEEQWRDEGKEEECDGESPGKKQKIGGEEPTCSKPSSSSQTETSQRKKIIEELEKLANAYNIRNDTWRSHSYRKAISAIIQYDKDISTYQEAVSIPGVGEKTALKIMEIIESGKLQKVDEIVDEKTKVMDSFCKIWGVGPSTAEIWYFQGFRTLEDLKTKAKLTKQQQIGLKLYDDLQKRIPREEVLKIAEVVRSELIKIQDSLILELVGSFRRGRETCGDVDCMIVNPGMKTAVEILQRVTESLRVKGYLSDDLVNLNNSDEEDQHKKYFGVFKLPGENQTHRRIDLFVVPKSEYAPALMHYTGSALFNRSIKLLAAKKNMTLTENGLYAGTVRKGSEVTCKGQLITTLTEEDIFKELGLPYRHPEERDH